jgi:hypothetical protein
LEVICCSPFIDRGAREGTSAWARATGADASDLLAGFLLASGEQGGRAV